MHVLKHHRGRSMLHVPLHRPVISTAGPAVDQLIGGEGGSSSVIGPGSRGEKAPGALFGAQR